MKPAVLIAFAFSWLCAAAAPVELAPGSSPADNPLKGLVPYAEPEEGCFPHSMEFSYLALSDLMTGAEAFDWRPMDKLLDGVSGRGNQTIFRVWIEYPGRKSGLPRFLSEVGVGVTEWENDKDKKPSDTRYSPDYRNEHLIRAMEVFISALGSRYDGDARIGYITAGLLGSWGEWHTFPRNDLFAPVETQRRVLAAYREAFRKTPILLRYPAGNNRPDLAANSDLTFGYHDDSFAWATLDTGKPGDHWFFLHGMKAAGEGALNKWRTQPIGGEVRPEVWGIVHDAKPGHPRAQDFMACVEQTHVTWLMESGLFEKRPDPERRRRAIEHVRRMGYDFHIWTAEIAREGEALKIGLRVINQGVAPFYQDWRMELAALDAQGGIVRRWPVDWKLTGIFPQEPPRLWSASLTGGDGLQGKILALRVPHPLANGKPLRFANADQDRDLAGWLSLGVIP
jgi:hypothetical protein